MIFLVYGSNVFLENGQSIAMNNALWEKIAVNDTI